MSKSPPMRPLVFGRAAVLFLGFMLGVLPAMLAAQTPPRAPDAELTGTITDADLQRYKRVPFTVPAGTERLVIAFDHDRRDQKTVIDLGIEDQHGFRGASGGNKASFTISATDATPSYLPGRIEPGAWALSLAIPNIRKGVTAHWTARLWFLKGAEAQTLPAPTMGRGPGWYRGDLHLHSAHSDGSCLSQSGRKVPCPLFRTLEAAAARKLDFVAITEHNTASHANVLREAQPYFDRMLLIPGREVTTFHGHFNIFGITEPIDFRIAPGIDNSFGRIADRVHALGGLVSINHPASPSGEICMGCGWTMPDADYRKVDMVEIANGGSMAETGNDPEGPLSGVPFWVARNGEGFPLAAVGGSDNHGPDRTGPGGVGSPVTVVFATDLSQSAILDGLRGGRSFIVIDPEQRGIHLDFSMRAGAGEAPMGGSLDAMSGRAVTLLPDVAGPDGAALEILDGERLLLRKTLSNRGLSDAVSLDLARGDHVVRVQLRSDRGELLAFGNAVRVHVR